MSFDRLGHKKHRRFRALATSSLDLGVFVFFFPSFFWLHILDILSKNGRIFGKERGDKDPVQKKRTRLPTTDNAVQDAAGRRRVARLIKGIVRIQVSDAIY
jgi:hypothetical protein